MNCTLTKPPVAFWNPIRPVLINVLVLQFPLLPFFLPSNSPHTTFTHHSLAHAHRFFFHSGALLTSHLTPLILTRVLPGIHMEAPGVLRCGTPGALRRATIKCTRAALLCLWVRLRTYLLLFDDLILFNIGSVYLECLNRSGEGVFTFRCGGKGFVGCWLDLGGVYIILL